MHPQTAHRYCINIAKGVIKMQEKAFTTVQTAILQHFFYPQTDKLFNFTYFCVIRVTSDINTG